MLKKLPYNSNARIVTALNIICAGIIILLPFHAFFTTWLGSTFGALDVFRIWKELLVAVAVVLCYILLVRQRDLRQRFFGSWLTRLIIAYCVLHIGIGAIAWQQDGVTLEALLYALFANTRYLIFFLVIWITASSSPYLRKQWPKLLLYPAAAVIGFGLLQQFVLPKDFLDHFGYGWDTIPAYQSVDQKPEFARIQSSLRGANPLGAYLVSIIVVIGGLLLNAKTTLRHRYGLYIEGIAALLVLFYTYSRSAWIGTVIALAVLVYLAIRKAAVRRTVLIGLAVFVVLLAGLLYMFRDNDRVQNTFFHTDETSLSSVSSNEQRASALTGGIEDVLRHPFGQGPGIAGPASTRNNGEANIAENYFIQIGQEVGIVGLALLGAITVLVVRRLYMQRSRVLPACLLAAFAGITVVNMFSHAWTDDTLGLLWWGLAGIAVTVSDILNATIHEKEKLKTQKKLA